MQIKSVPVDWFRCNSIYMWNMLCITALPISNRASFLSLKILIKNHLWWTDNADRMRSGLLIPLFLHTCVAAVVGNAPVKFEALIFFTFNDINKNVRPQAPQAAQAPMCHSTRPCTSAVWAVIFLKQWAENQACEMQSVADLEERQGT